ncbi:baeRF7 domain-containing protein [Lutibacter flavus]|uniref:Uncharacterized protein n=1 Tax=Lutibacter flavus TaxID=691689 RepID=A0A238XKY7_9FLAO|nr:hypothetical protein [Lutibacter flavus]SNR59597.1 hypothetical protein SAMN04488111_1916 [Lutibacter flavus]
MYISNNHPLPLKTFKSLAKDHNLHCVSIYLPMDKNGKEQNEHLAQSKLSKCIRDVHKSLLEHEINEKEITNYLMPIQALIVDSELWRNPSDGLALFLDKNGLKYYTLPIPFEAFTFVADHFYLKPLLPLYHDDGLYYVLELSEDYVKLFEGSRYSFKDLYFEDFTPDQLEKVVGSDYKPKMFQFRSGQNAFGSGSFHGHGEGKDDKQKELTAFFKAIDKGVNKAIKNKKAPLLIAGVSKLYSGYKEANTYPNFYDKYISGDPQFKDKKKLHEESWKLMEGYFEKTKKDKLNQFTELYSTPKISYQVNEIIPAALNGKIDTLFVQKDIDIYGTYNKENGYLTLNSKKKLSNGSLTNLSSIKTFMQGGNVYILEPQDMPEKGRPLNAILRY